jgi:hypothetical protein
MIGYHRRDHQVRIQLLFHLDNTAPSGTNNFLNVLHRGNVQFEVVPAWPFPSHPDEEAGNETGVLNEIYGPMFSAAGKDLFQIRTLTAWDDYQEVERRRVIQWPPKIDNHRSPRSYASYSVSDQDTFDRQQLLPFSTFTLGPFTEEGSYLIALRMNFSGKVYDQLTGDHSEFTVDGPIRLLSRIKYQDILKTPIAEQSAWRNRLKPFEDEALLPGEGYDVVLLGPPSADHVVPLSTSGISLAPLQPKQLIPGVVQRFVSANQRFTLTLRYDDESTSRDECASALQSV